MFENISTHMDTIIIVLSMVLMFLHLQNDLKKEFNQRIDDLRSDMYGRIDDLKSDHNSLSTKVDNLTAEVNKLSGAVQTILFLMRPGQPSPLQGMNEQPMPKE